MQWLIKIREMKDILSNKSEELKQTVLRLSHFNPTVRDEYGNQVIDYLVLNSLASYGAMFKVSVSKIKKHIKNTFHLDFEKEEIIASGKRLFRKDMIKYIGEIEEEERIKEEPKFLILPEIQNKIDRNLSEVIELEKEVMEEWKEEVCNRVEYKDFPVLYENIDLIEDYLHNFIYKIFLRHGVECVALLYPDKSKTQKWLSNIGNNILEDFPKLDPFIDSIMKIEIPKFFKTTNSKRRLYIVNLFNGSFFWHLIQVDEKCSKLLREVTRGQKLLLDNNIIYSLVGLDGAYLLQSVHNMLKIAGNLGYELFVTTKTLEEFNESLKRRMKEVEPIPKELARIAVDNLDEDNFMVCYWKELVENGISIQEFVAEKSHIEDILKGLKICKTKELREDIESSKEFKEEKSILRRVAHEETDPHIIEHDAFHRVLISKLRDGEKYNFPDAVAWFLTRDTKLPAYDRVARKGKESLPFCLLTNQWIQINRPLLARTADESEYERSYYILVTQPYIRALVSSFPLEKAYNEVLGRSSRYKNMNKQLPLNIVTDVLFMASIASETDQEKIDEKIENKFVNISAQLQKEKKILEEEVNEKDKTVKDLEERVGALENKRQSEIENLKEELKSEKKKTQDAIDELDKLKQADLRRSAKIWLGITVFIFIILEVFFLWSAVCYGEGKNLWLKISSFTFYLVILGPGISWVIGWRLINKERLEVLGWFWKKIFKSELKDEKDK